MNTNKLVMFDYGGVVERLDKVVPPIYTYRDIMGAAVLYATGIRPSEGQSFSELVEKCYNDFSADSISKHLMTKAVNADEIIDSIGMYLCSVAQVGTASAHTYGTRYVDFVRSNYHFIPQRDEMISLQKGTKRSCLIGLMSNTSALWYPKLVPLSEDVKYDVTWLSFQNGVCKPDSTAWLQVEKMSGLKGNQILLLDDEYENVKSAIDHGWCAYQVPQDNTRINCTLAIDQFIADDEDGMKSLTSYPVK